MAQTYFGSKISNNMLKTPENFLICYNVPVARTGVQKYLGKELGMDGEEADKIIKVYRTEKEVFSPKTIASFEGKPFTDEHPSDWVTPLNFQVYGKGVVSNVRRGTGKENDLLLADIVVYSQQQIDEIENKWKREISCGYECEYVPYKDGYMQQNIVGNHIALVSAGRAGGRVAIKDNKLKAVENKGGNKKLVNFKIPRHLKVSEYLKGVGLKQIAMDADPEELLSAMQELVNEKREEKTGDETPQEAQQNVQKEEIKPEVQSKIDDEEAQELEKVASEVKDALYQFKAYLQDEQIKEPEDEGMLTDSLDELETELKEKKEEEAENKEEEKEPEEEGKDALDAGEVEEIESVEKPAEEINKQEDTTDACNRTADAAIKMIRALKPFVAAIPDKKERKKASDSLAQVLREQIKEQEKAEKARKSKDSVYTKLAQNKRKTVNDSKVIDIGEEIAKKYNPHYKVKGEN